MARAIQKTALYWSHLKTYARNFAARPYNRFTEWPFTLARKALTRDEEVRHVTYTPMTNGGEGWYITESPELRALTQDFNARALRVAERYRRFKLHMTETRHRWTRTGETRAWMDNSADAEEVSAKTGEKRWVQTMHPHGDVCY